MAKQKKLVVLGLAKLSKAERILVALGAPVISVAQVTFDLDDNGVFGEPHSTTMKAGALTPEVRAIMEQDPSLKEQLRKALDHVGV